MLSAAELSKVGSLVALVADSEVVDIQKLLLLVQWAAPDLAELQLVLVEASVVDSEVAFRIVETEEAAADSAVAFKTEEAMVVEAAEVVSDIKAKVVDSKLPEVHSEAIVVHPTTLVPPVDLLPMAELVEVAFHEVVTVVQAPQIAMALAAANQWALQWEVGMILVVAAHMMTDPEVAIAEAAEVMIPVQQVVAATWNR